MRIRTRGCRIRVIDMLRSDVPLLFSFASTDLRDPGRNAGQGPACLCKKNVRNPLPDDMINSSRGKEKGIMSRKIGPVVIAFLVAVAFVLAPQMDAVHAGEVVKTVKYQKKVTVSTLEKKAVFNISSKFKKTKNVKAKSSQPSVVAVKKKSGKFYLTIKKPGRAKLTFTNKKTGKKYTSTIRVVKYKSPFKTFKLGKKSVKGKFKTRNTGTLKTKATKAKVNIKPKWGWQVKKITYITLYQNDDKNVYKRTGKTVANKSSIKIKHGKWYYHALKVKMYNKYWKQTEYFYLNF